LNEEKGIALIVATHNREFARKLVAEQSFRAGGWSRHEIRARISFTKVLEFATKKDVSGNPMAISKS
jgi:hypothetical protein